MKKMSFLCIMLLSASQIFSQTLFTYGAEAVSKDEFLRAYNKNKTPDSEKERSYREYLDLYAKFKLKVKAAKELRLDTLQQLQSDIDGFRTQVEEGYMNDDKGVEDLVNEAFNRSQKEIHVMHFYVPVNTSMTTADSLKAIKLIEQAHDELSKGREDYAGIAAELSAQYKMILTASDLGYVTAFSVPYEYENIVYGLKPNEISNPYRTKKAWHLFKNIDERKNSGKWKVAQILLLFPPDATAEQREHVKQKADSVYKLLEGGAEFIGMVKKFSEDKVTLNAGGELPEFSTGKYSLNFEKAVFALKNDGDLSKPILTSYGYHIVKRLKHTPSIFDKSDEAAMYDLKQKVQQDTRINIAKAKFLKDVLVKINYKRNEAVKDKDLFGLADSVLKNKELVKTSIDKLPVFSFSDKTIKGADWLGYVKEYAQNNTSTDDSAKGLFEKYVNAKAFEYYRENLEKYSVDFKYQMQEFKEGNMLFEVMERNVWSKAANDSVGLKKYYTAHQSKYLWEASADVVIYNCSDSEVAEIAAVEVKKGKSWKTIAEESNATIQADSGRYELTQIPVTKVLTEGLVTKPIVSVTDGTASFVQVIKLYPANQQRNFEEARGLVINDYQNYLEEHWIESLKKKYPIKINESVFKTLLK
ncbi:peptidylprolyl isomerase [Ferruginibacter lapsinanis]|uniref:peptidylprolyl isomerase n=1 Tax=Ferruginibacter lapsinanis TaxID=563172 RepID=UPI001E3B678F|nr:peptidylprolyl isomerase [Ferruginibacter lapsinanis]UEG50840.1 peptidylprolyl isomerase [Ferruginibacter lapsinanis]